MTELRRLSINGFRGLDSLEIDGFSKVNLFVGKNNAGKTSILEAIFLLTGMSNPMLANTINQIRGLNVGSAKQLGYLFYGLNAKSKPSFSAWFSDSSERTLRIEAKYKQNESLTSTSSALGPELVGLDLNFREEKSGPILKSSLVFVDDNLGNNLINHTLPECYAERFHSTLVVDRIQNNPSMLMRLSEIIKRKQEDAVLEALKKFDDSIAAIRVLPDNIFFDLKNMDELMPINVMGDGVRRFLNIVTSAFEKKNSFVCIDEIENGLHCSAYKLLWKSLLSFSNLNGIQLFITTHNIETLACLKNVLEEKEFGQMRECAKVFTISRTKNSGLKAYRYSFEGFRDAIEFDSEIRD